MVWPRFVLFLLVGVSSQFTDLAKLYKEVCNPFKPSENRKVPQSGFFAPPGIDCPTYAISCSNGEAHLEYCSPGQVFFDNKCRAASTRCGGRDEIDCSVIVGRQMIPNGCSGQYFWCTNGILSRHKCPDNTYFNPDNGQCDFWENVQLCNPRDPTEPTVPTIPPTPSFFQIYQNSFNCKGVENGDYPDPKQNCVPHYFTCSNEIPYLRNCSANLYFDPELMACERVERIPACGGQRPTPPPSSDVFTCPSLDGDYPDDNIAPCSQSYVNCKNEKPTEKFCKDGEAFNPAIGICDQKKNVIGCDPGYCETMKDGRYKVPNAPPCNSNYLECVNSRSFVRPCATTLIYNPSTKYCEYQHDVEECGEPKDLPIIDIPEMYPTASDKYPTAQEDPSPPTYESRASQQDSSPPNFKSKQTHQEPIIPKRDPSPPQYVPPVDTTPTTAQPADPVVHPLFESYSPPKDQPTLAPVPCVNVTQSPENVQVGSYVSPTPRIVADSGPCSNKADGRYPGLGSKTCDSSYMKCKNGRYSMRQCSASLVFNRATTDCDFPQNVEECRGSIVQDATVAPQTYNQKRVPVISNTSQYQSQRPSDVRVSYRTTKSPTISQDLQQPKNNHLTNAAPQSTNVRNVLNQRNTLQQRPNDVSIGQPLLPINRQPLQPVNRLPLQPINRLPSSQSGYGQLASYFPGLQQPIQLPSSDSFVRPSDMIGKSSYMLVADNPFSLCPKNEVFVKCARTCEITCPPSLATDCDGMYQCKPACHCKPGYVRALTGDCILTSQCSLPVGADFSFGGAFDDPEFFDYGIEVEDGWRHSGEDYDSGKPHDHANDFFCKYRDDGHYAMPGNLCTDLYYKCRHNRVQFWRCGNHRYFDHDKKRCTSKSQNHCWDSVTALPTFFCQGKYENKNYSYPFPDCSKKYYSCNGGDATLTECPSGYRFSDYKNRCVSKHRCHERRGRDADPDKWFCKDKIDHGFSYPKLICTKRYYQCYDGLASFRLCRHDHVWDGFSCVPEQYCIDNDARNIVETSNSDALSVNDLKDTINNNIVCNGTGGDFDFVVSGPANCSQLFGVCVNKTTTTHYCGGKSVIEVNEVGSIGVAKCKSLQVCRNASTVSDNLVNDDYPENDDYCTKDNLGFHYKYKCGQKYALCYCANADNTICNATLLRLSCKNRHYVFDKTTNQCVLRRKVHKCKYKFDTKEFCHRRKRRTYSLAPCYNEYVDCRDNAYRQCNRGEFFSTKYGCSKRKCGRRQFSIAADLSYYPEEGAADVSFENVPYSSNYDRFRNVLGSYGANIPFSGQYGMDSSMSSAGRLDNTYGHGSWMKGSDSRSSYGGSGAFGPGMDIGNNPQYGRPSSQRYGNSFDGVVGSGGQQGRRGADVGQTYGGSFDRNPPTLFGSDAEQGSNVLGSAPQFGRSDAGNFDQYGFGPSDAGSFNQYGGRPHPPPSDERTRQQYGFQSGDVDDLDENFGNTNRGPFLYGSASDANQPGVPNVYGDVQHFGPGAADAGTSNQIGSSYQPSDDNSRNQMYGGGASSGSEDLDLPSENIGSTDGINANRETPKNVGYGSAGQNVDSSASAVDGGLDEESDGDSDGSVIGSGSMGQNNGGYWLTPNGRNAYGQAPSDQEIRIGKTQYGTGSNQANVFVGASDPSQRYGGLGSGSDAGQRYGSTGSDAGQIYIGTGSNAGAGLDVGRQSNGGGAQNTGQYGDAAVDVGQRYGGAADVGQRYSGSSDNSNGQDSIVTGNQQIPNGYSNTQLFGPSDAGTLNNLHGSVAGGYQKPADQGLLQTYGSLSSDSGDVNLICNAKGDGYYRHPQDCTKFVQCFRMIAHVLSCAPGLVFNPNPNVKTCDWPRNVPDCSSVGTVSDPECVGRKHGEFFRHRSDCRKFFRCVHGKVYKFDCPANLFFNMNLKVCDWPVNVPECGNVQVSYSR